MEIGFKFRNTDLSNFDKRWWSLYSKSFLYSLSSTIQILFDPLLKKFHNRTDTNLYSLVATIYILMIFGPNMILTQHITWPSLGFWFRRYLLNSNRLSIFCFRFFFCWSLKFKRGNKAPSAPQHHSNEASDPKLGSYLVPAQYSRTAE